MLSLDDELDDNEGGGSDVEGGFFSPSHYVDTSRIEEVPAREPRLDMKPLKSALKKKPASTANGTLTPTGGTPTESKPLYSRQEGGGSNRYGHRFTQNLGEGRCRTTEYLCSVIGFEPLSISLVCSNNPAPA